MKRILFYLSFMVGAGLLLWLLLISKKEFGMQTSRGTHQETTQENPKVQLYVKTQDGQINLSEQAIALAGIQIKTVNGEIPPSAIVWFEDKSFVFVMKAPGTFLRVVIKPGLNNHLTQPVVITGAQLLLSYEQRNFIPEEKG